VLIKIRIKAFTLSMRTCSK